FKGQPFIAGEEYTRDLGEQKKTKVTAISIFDKEPSGQSLVEDDYDLGYSNATIKISQEKLLENIRQIQAESNLHESRSLLGNFAAVYLDVEMETETGKTYVYTRTIFELNKRYGWSKFIIVVPSVAIREGINKSFQQTQEHFMDLYGKKIRFFIYNSSNLGQIDQFSKDSSINVMIINMQSFNSRAMDARRIYEQLDDFQSRRPIDVIAKNRPILILDEPQKMGGEATQASLHNFNPLFVINYSATH